MKKFFNDKHEAIIESLSILSKNVKSPQDGDVVEHTNFVQSATIYLYDGDGKYRKFSISRDMILDLSKQIEEIESITWNEEYKDMPF